MDPRWLVVVAPASACVPVPPFRGDDAPPPPQQAALLTVLQSGPCLDEGDRVLLWFRDGLAVDEPVTIDPR